MIRKSTFHHDLQHYGDLAIETQVTSIKASREMGRLNQHFNREKCRRYTLARYGRQHGSHAFASLSAKYHRDKARF
jgi:type II secretory pathway component PulC